MFQLDSVNDEPESFAPGEAINRKGNPMKYAILGAAATLVLTFTAYVPSANAVVCAKGVYRAGCAGPHGAVVARRPAYPGAVVVRRPPVYHGAVVVRRPVY